MIFIDGGHIYSQVKHDYNKWSKQLKKGGYILLHDCTLQYLGILRLCGEIQLKNEMQFIEQLGCIRVYKNYRIDCGYN
jgi:hypothetical protein